MTAARRWRESISVVLIGFAASTADPAGRTHSTLSALFGPKNVRFSTGNVGRLLADGTGLRLSCPPKESGNSGYRDHRHVLSHQGRYESVTFLHVRACRCCCLVASSVIASEFSYNHNMITSQLRRIMAFLFFQLFSFMWTKFPLCTM
jgi:hypothetical protein